MRRVHGICQRNWLQFISSADWIYWKNNQWGDCDFRGQFSMRCFIQMLVKCRSGYIRYQIYIASVFGRHNCSNIVERMSNARATVLFMYEYQWVKIELDTLLRTTKPRNGYVKRVLGMDIQLTDTKMHLSLSNIVLIHTHIYIYIYTIHHICVRAFILVSGAMSVVLPRISLASTVSFLCMAGQANNKW